MTSLQKKASENAAGKGRLEVWSVKSEWAYVQGEFTGWNRRLSPHQLTISLKERRRIYGYGASRNRLYKVLRLTPNSRAKWEILPPTAASRC